MYNPPLLSSMVMVYDFNFFVLGHLVILKNGAPARKFINFAIRLQDRILERILSMCMTAFCVYLVCAGGHHGYT